MTLMQPEPGERAAFSAWRSILEVHSALTRRLDAALQDRVDIPLAWYDVLVHVHEAPTGRIRLRSLEERVLMTQSTLSRVATRMQVAGLLTRRVPADDRRAVEVRLTAAGTRRLQRAREVAIAELRQTIVTALSEDEAHQLLRLLEKVRRR